MKPIKVGLLGLGTVGTGVVRIVEGHQEDLQSQIGSPIEVAQILVQNKSKAGILMLNAASLPKIHGILSIILTLMLLLKSWAALNGTKEYLLAALDKGKHIVTANKDLMALHGPEILAKAAENGCDVFYEASVAGGIPIIRTLIEGFSSDRITKIMGIVNGTTNYIFSKMSQEGAAYQMF